LSIIQGPFSVAPCQTLISRFATFASPYVGAPRCGERARVAGGVVSAAPRRLLELTAPHHTRAPAVQVGRKDKACEPEKPRQASGASPRHAQVGVASTGAKLADLSEAPHHAPLSRPTFRPRPQHSHSTVAEVGTVLGHVIEVVGYRVGRSARLVHRAPATELWRGGEAEMRWPDGVGYTDGGRGGAPGGVRGTGVDLSAAGPATPFPCSFMASCCRYAPRDSVTPVSPCARRVRASAWPFV
jgi:hypothetical protein